MPSLKILVVDDEPAILAFLQSVVESLGYKVRTAVCNSLETADEIVQTARIQRFNIAIIGIVMPGLNGMELAERIYRVAPTTKLVLAFDDVCVECARVLRTKGIGAESLPAPFDHEDLRLLLSSLADPPSRAMVSVEELRARALVSREEVDRLYRQDSDGSTNNLHRLHETDPARYALVKAAHDSFLSEHDLVPKSGADNRFVVTGKLAERFSLPAGYAVDSTEYAELNRIAGEVDEAVKTAGA